MQLVLILVTKYGVFKGNTLWIVVPSESSLFDQQNCSAKYDGFFNWTFTYRRDSDIVRAEGDFVLDNSLPPDALQNNVVSDRYIQQFGQSNRNLIQGKRKSVAWIVSHPNAISGRDKYVKELKKHIDVSLHRSL